MIAPARRRMQKILETASWARVMRRANNAGTRLLGGFGKREWKVGLDVVYNQ